MKTKRGLMRRLSWLLVVLLAAPPSLIAQQPEGTAVFKQEELEQIVAPIALHPDDLIAQILMASTYPLEIVQAERFAKQNASLKGDALTAALEKQNWDPSVKSLVNFPQVLTMMSEKLDWTQKLGDAFLADQKKVLDTIQSMRAKAQAAGNLKTTNEQKVIVEEKIIKIEPANPEVIYVPTYNPTVVYGGWPYPAYPPYAYYPPGYVASSMLWFGAGMAMGAAWGYAWGNSNWGGGDININNSRNTNINNNIDRNQGQTRPAGNQGSWQHNAEHRKGVSYRDQGTAQKYNKAGTNDAVKSREQFRGRAEQGGAGDRGGAGQSGGGNRPATADRGGASQLGGGGDRGGASQTGGGGDRGGASQPVAAATAAVAATGAAPIRAWIAAEAPPAVPVNGAARAGPVPAAAAGRGGGGGWWWWRRTAPVRKVASDECRVKIPSTPDRRPAYLISWRKKRCFTIKAQIRTNTQAGNGPPSGR